MISGKNALTCYSVGLKDAPERTYEACGKTFRAGEQYAYKLWSSAAHKKHVLKAFSATRLNPRNGAGSMRGRFISGKKSASSGRAKLRRSARRSRTRP